MNLARLNHILIPTTAEARDRWRRSLPGRVIQPAWALYTALSDEGRALSIVILFVGAASVDVARTQVYFLWSALLGLLGAALIVRRWFAMSEVALRVRAPRRVAAHEPMRIELSLENRGAEPVYNVRVRGPFLPWDGRWRGARPTVRELGPGRTERLEASLVFVQRGPHHLDRFHACQLVPFGLALGPRVESEQCRFLVVPRMPRIVRLTLPGGGGGRAGEMRRVFAVGDTSELAGVRPYRVGDPIRDLHAKTWGRTGQPHVRQYEQILQRRVIVVLAPDRSADEVLFEGAVSLAAGVVAHLYQRDIVIDLALASEPGRVTSVGRGVAPFEIALDVLATLGEQGAEDLTWIDGLLAARARSTSAVVFVTASRGRALRLPGSHGIPTRTLRVARRTTGSAGDATVVTPGVLFAKGGLSL